MKGKENRYLILTSVMLGGIAGPIDASAVNTINPTIASHFGTTITMEGWVSMIYLLVISSLLPLFARLGEMHGYKKVYLMGAGGIIITSILCALSALLPSIYYLILFRALEGITAAMMGSVPYAILTASFPPQERGKVLGINAISVSVGLAIGPSLGGFTASSLGWPIAFLANVPFALAGLMLGLKAIPEIRGEPGELDSWGAFLSFISLLFLLLFVDMARESGLNALNTLVIVIGIIAGIAFIKLERRAGKPLIDLGLFDSRTFTYASFSALLNFMSQYVMVFLTPFFLALILGLQADEIGLIMMSFPLATMCVAPFAGALSDRVGTKPLASLGAFVCASALFFMCFLNDGTTPLDVSWRMALFGIGTGLFQSPNNSAAMGSAPFSRLGTASGIMAVMRHVGMTLGIACAGAIVYAFAPVGVLEIRAIAQSGFASFMSGCRVAYAAGALFTGLATLTSLFMEG